MSVCVAGSDSILRFPEATDFEQPTHTGGDMCQLGRCVEHPHGNDVGGVPDGGGHVTLRESACFLDNGWMTKLCTSSSNTSIMSCLFSTKD